MSRGGVRPGAGRPCDAESPRDRMVKVMLTDGELGEILGAAGDAPMSAWLRDLALERARYAGPTVPPSQPTPLTSAGADVWPEAVTNAVRPAALTRKLQG